MLQRVTRRLALTLTPGGMRLTRRSLRAQLVLTLLAMGIGIIALSALPIAFLVRLELDRQTQARLDQAVAITRALYAARLRETTAVASLTAQRPTLRSWLDGRTGADFNAYLNALRLGARVGALVVLDQRGQPVGVAAAPHEAGQAAAQTLQGRVGLQPDATLAQLDNRRGAMLAAEAPVLTEDGSAVRGWTRVAVLIDEEFVVSLKDETGLDHSLWRDDEPLVSTLSASVAPLLTASADERLRPLYTLGGEAYFVTRLPLAQTADGAIVDLIALPATDILNTTERIHRILGLGGAVFALLVVGLGYVLADHVTRPLQRLAQASETLGRGDLTTPLPVSQDVAEIETLTRTLEQMRRRLQTAYTELTRSKKWSENLIANLTEGVVTVDADGRITSFSVGAERILGWQSHEVIGRRYAQVFRAAADTPPRAHVAPGELERVRVLTRGARPITITITGGVPMTRDGVGWEQAHVFRDVTAEEESQRLREAFLAHVSHEFKTPLAALRAAMELLAAEGDTLTASERDELMDSSMLGVMRLEELVDNLLSSASIQSGQFEVRARPTDLEALTEEVMLTTRPLLALRGQSLTLTVPPSLPLVNADPRRIRQVLVNLVSNASKYGAPHRSIGIQIDRADSARVRVTNEGDGVSAERVTDLFKPFKRSADQNDAAGVGLGLSIVKTIVERHGGQVGMEQRGALTEFWFTLPWALTENED